MATHGRSGLGAFWADSVGHRLYVGTESGAIDVLDTTDGSFWWVTD